MDYGLKDKVVLVTGSTKGLGKAIAELIAQEEGIPVVTGRREKEVHEIMMELREKYQDERIQGYCVDFSELSSVDFIFDVIKKDLAHVKDIGFNAIAIFVYYDTMMESNNILHLLHLCEEMELYVDLSIRPAAYPFAYDAQQVQTMLTKLHFSKLDHIIAYDIAWEPQVGDENGQCPWICRHSSRTEHIVAAMVNRTIWVCSGSRTDLRRCSAAGCLRKCHRSS